MKTPQKSPDVKGADHEVIGEVHKELALLTLKAVQLAREKLDTVDDKHPIPMNMDRIIAAATNFCRSTGVRVAGTKQFENELKAAMARDYANEAQRRATIEEIKAEPSLKSPKEWPFTLMEGTGTDG